MIINLPAPLDRMLRADMQARPPDTGFPSVLIACIIDVEPVAGCTPGAGIQETG